MTTQTTFSVKDRSAKIAPRVVVLAARSIPLIIVAQFLLAGLSMFQDAAIWEGHGVLGFVAFVPIAAVLIATLTRPSVRPLRWWAMVLALLYALQIIWIVAGQMSGSGMLMAMHPFNASLLLIAALVIVAKLKRSHSPR